MTASLALTDGAGRILRGRGRQWPATLSSAFVELEFELLERPRLPLRGSIHEYAFGDLTLQRSLTTGQAHRVTRSERLIRVSSHDNFFVGLMLSGGAVFRQDGHTARLGPGDIALLDSTRVYSVEVPREFDALWMRVPRLRLQERLHHLAHVMAVRIDGQHGIGCVASRLLRGALTQATLLNEGDACRISGILFDLLDAALETPRVRSRPPSKNSEALLRRVRAFIEPRLQDEALTPAAVAHANGVSVPYINRLLRPEGYTLARWIRTQRLERCRMDLEDARLASLRVADIACSYGFKSVSHFNRLFRARFGYAPERVRDRRAADDFLARPQNPRAANS